jgi:ElaB/YqjD/DUF883 family membrane-anchored ribosome-binding protein
MDSESPEVIEQQMEETRQSLTDKVAALENQVVGTVQTATQVVQDTVETMKSAVQETVSTVKDTVQESVSAVKDTVQESVSAVTDGVKETFDVKHHVQENPALMVGGAVVAGLITGLLFFRKQGSGAGEGVPPPSYPPNYDVQPARAAEPERSGFIDELMNMAGIEGKQLAREAVNQAAQAMRQHVMPTLMDWVTQNIEKAFQRPATPESAWERSERTFAHR